MAAAPPGGYADYGERWLASRGSMGAVAGASRSGGAIGVPHPGDSSLPAQSSRTGQTSQTPMSIVTSRLSTATWYAAIAERVEEQEERQRRRAACR